VYKATVITVKFNDIILWKVRQIIAVT